MYLFRRISKENKMKLNKKREKKAERAREINVFDFDQ
jgi:hypothetical protein